MIPVAKKMLLPLLRPQYVAVPEALITALAWRVFDVKVEPDHSGKQVGLLFRTNPKQTKTLAIRATEPEGERLRAFGEALRKEGLKTSGDPITLARAVSNSIAGVRAGKSGSQPASPITPAFALLQNMRGLQGAKNPPDFAEIIESLYRMGLPKGANSAGAAQLWLAAAEHRMETDPLAGALDRAVDAALLDGARQRRIADHTQRAEPWQGLFANTPFEWFASSWDRLNDPLWVEALPARVWVDWATTVLRLAVGLGFLWEAAWYEAVAREVLSLKSPTWDGVKASVAPPLPWKSSRAGLGIRDVAPLLGLRVHRGEQIRGLLSEWLEDNGKPDEDFTSALHRMHADEKFCDRLVEALGSRRRTASGGNLWEAVKYALKTRENSGPFADYYGLLQSNGRFLTVDPGTEWMAVVASLACPEPGKPTDVGAVLASLSQLGVRPELADLIALLERAGLARGSADADQGVVVQSAF